MLRLHDNAASGNAYKVRLLLTQLGIARSNASNTTPTTARRARPSSCATRTRTGASRCWSWKTAAACRNRTRSSGTWRRARRTCPRANDEAGRWQRAQVLQWMFFEQYSHEPNIATVRAWITHNVEMTPDRVAALPGKRKGGVAALEVMEQHLRTRGFFVGDGYTIADIALYAYTHVAHEGGFDLAPFPAVRAWLARVAASRGTSGSPTSA